MLESLFNKVAGLKGGLLQTNSTCIGNVIISKTRAFLKKHGMKTLNWHFDLYFDMSYTLRDDHTSEFCDRFLIYRFHRQTH